MELALRIIQFISCLGVIVFVLLQQSKGEGLGSIGGGARLFFSRNKGLEILLNRLTAGFAVLFMVASVILAIFI
jgi:preprotein translocase subunit SecG